MLRPTVPSSPRIKRIEPQHGARARVWRVVGAGVASSALLVSLAADAQPTAPSPTAGEGAAAPADAGAAGAAAPAAEGDPRPDWGAWDDLDSLSPWAPPSDVVPSVPRPEPPASGNGQRPDWGTSDELDTRSPWDPSEQRRWGASPDTVSPWDAGATGGPAEVTARFDRRFGPSSRRRPGWAPLVPHGTYDRPHLVRLGSDDSAIAIGGYVDMVTSYVDKRDSPEGVRFEPRTLELFFTSRIADRVRVAADIAFEDGAERVAVHTAQIDILFHLGLGLRAGIVEVPIGKLNIAHDAPLYDVVDRPLLSSDVIPVVFAEPGVALFGALGAPRGHRLTYEVMAVRGLNSGLLTSGGTHLGAGYDSDFGSQQTGSPAIAGRFAYLSAPHRSFHGELGFSFYAGVYDDQPVGGRAAEARWLRLLALDGELGLGPLVLRGEVVYAHIELAAAQTELHAPAQLGFYSEADLTFFRRKLGFFERASLAAVARGDYVDRNLARGATGVAVGEVTSRLTLGPSFRPAPGTALKLMYFHEWLTDANNYPERAGGVQLGVSSYF